MAKPPVPEWDKNQTHLIPPVAGHKSDGYGSNEVPGSDELNGWMNLVYRNIALMQQQRIVDGLREIIPLLDGSVTTQTDPEMTRQSTNTDCIYALALSGGSAYLKQGSANNKLKIAAGTLLQLRGGELYAYQFDGTSEVTIPNGDASNPRVDIVQMQLDVDATSTPTVSLSVKSGTAAASPTYPAPDAGFCVVAAVVVGATWAGGSPLVLGEDTAGVAAVVHDQRVPLGVRPHVVMPKDYSYFTDWALISTDTMLRKTNNTAGNAIFIPCPYGGYTGRLLGVGQINLAAGPAQHPRLIRLKHYDNSGTPTALDVGLANTQIGGSASYAWRQSAISQNGVTNFQSQQYDRTGEGIPLVQSNANGMGPPIWTNGRRCATAPQIDGSEGAFPSSHGVLYHMWVAPGTSDVGSTWGPTTWWIAGGL